MDKFKIKQTDKLTGKSSFSKVQIKEEIIDGVVEDMNKLYPELEHEKVLIVKKTEEDE